MNDPNDTRRRAPVPVVPPNYVTVAVGATLLPATIIFWADGHGMRGSQPQPYLRFEAGKEEDVVRALKNIQAQVESVVTLRKMREAAERKREWEEASLRAQANGEQPPPIPVGVTVLKEERPTAINLEESEPSMPDAAHG